MLAHESQLKRELEAQFFTSLHQLCCSTTPLRPLELHHHQMDVTQRRTGTRIFKQKTLLAEEKKTFQAKTTCGTSTISTAGPHVIRLTISSLVFFILPI